MTLLRDGYDEMGIRLKQWSGAGSAAGALITKMELKKRNFPADIRTLKNKVTKQQSWVHAATHAGRIELLQQGYAPNQKLYGRAVVSTYPHGCLELPSMRDGTWENKVPALHSIARANMLSTYKVTWRFPECVMRKGVITPIRFFPLPYRSKKLHGAILYPAAGCGIFMRDDVVGALKWIEALGLPPQPCDSYVFIIEEAMEFHPGNDEMPFKGDNAIGLSIEDLYEERRRIKEANSTLRN